MAPEIVRQLGPHQYYFEGCAGSMSIIMAKEPSEHETVCDLHGALTNLAWAVQDEEMAVELFNRLQRTLYDDELYYASKEWLNAWDQSKMILRNGDSSLDWAYHYFVASWMGRNGVAGTSRVNYQVATRWTKGGGSGPLRFHSAVDSIPAWCERLRNVQILRRDLFEVLPKIEDDNGVAMYFDPPYLPGTISGNSVYVHTFADADHKRLADELQRFKKARIVISYYDSPLLAELYPGWDKMDCSCNKQLHNQNKRGRTMSVAPEVLLCNETFFRAENELFG